jgi:hypothetical protein
LSRLTEAPWLRCGGEPGHQQRPRTAHWAARCAGEAGDQGGVPISSDQRRPIGQRGVRIAHTSHSMLVQRDSRALATRGEKPYTTARGSLLLCGFAHLSSSPSAARPSMGKARSAPGLYKIRTFAQSERTRTRTRTNTLPFDTKPMLRREVGARALRNPGGREGDAAFRDQSPPAWRSTRSKSTLRLRPTTEWLPSL